jgi:hypothetical protein
VLVCGPYAALVRIRVASHVWGAGAVVTAAAALLTATVPAGAAITGWRQVYSAHYGAAANLSRYDGAVISGANNAWVLGGTDGGYGYAPSGKPVAVHWDGKAWRQYPMPRQATGEIYYASSDSARDTWAVTQYSAYVLHWNGTHWSVAKHLPPNGEVTGITAISPADVWVFGGGGTIGGIGTWHYNGKTWQQWKGSAAGLERGSAVSAKDIWAVGGALAPGSAIEHFNGRTWQFVTAKALSGLSFRDIAAFSSTDVWAGAASAAGSALMHYNGKTWARVVLPWRIDVTVLLQDGHGGLWFTGYSSTGQRYLVHRAANGAWTRTAIPASVPGAIELVPGTAAALSIGGKAAGPGSNAVIWAYGKI